MNERTVFAVIVKTKHMFSDFFQGVRNLAGMNLIAYERMIEDGLGEALMKLTKKYPGVYDVKFSTTQVTQGAAEIICYGKWRDNRKLNRKNKKHNSNSKRKS